MLKELYKELIQPRQLVFPAIKNSSLNNCKVNQSKALLLIWRKHHSLEDVFIDFLIEGGRQSSLFQG